ncbi:hypothetical protein P9112_014418 [Eukaryota sp. TZLM1-RC]
MAHLGSLLSRVFAMRFPENSHFLTQHQFSIQCLDFVAASEPDVRHPFNRPGKGHVYEKLQRISTSWPFAVLLLSKTCRVHAQLTSGPLQQLVDAKCRQLQGNYQQLLADVPLSWKLNFFRSNAVGHNCPAPATYAGFVLHSSTNFREPLPSWFNTHHTMALTLYNILLSSRRVTPNQENSTYIFRCGLTIQNHLEQAFAHTFRRHRLTPSTKANEYTISSNGDSVRITFKPHPKAARVRLSGEALADKRSRTTRNRKHTLQAKIERPRPRQKPKATEWQAPDDETEMVFWVIDPNHSNLCGSSIATRSGPTVYNIFLAPKQQKINHSASLTHSSIDVYDVQKSNHYLLEISTIGDYKDYEGNNVGRSLLKQQLYLSARKALMRNTFDFFIRKQKIFSSIINKVKKFANGREVKVWFGNGGGGTSRQKVKTARKAFLKLLQCSFAKVKIADEYMTSAKVNCCKMLHQKIYRKVDGEVKVHNAYFSCPECNQVWSRDISASLNQLEIAISEHYYRTRPEALQRPQRN